MKKNDRSIKPLLVGNTIVTRQMLDEIRYRYTQCKPFMDELKHKLKYFEDMQNGTAGPGARQRQHGKRNQGAQNNQKN